MSLFERYVRRSHEFDDPYFIFLGDEAADPASHYKYIGRSAKGATAIDEACAHQLDFLRGRGLEPHHVLLDLGCGSLRAGVGFIPFLDEGCYLGLDISAEALRRGIEEEVPADLLDRKRPAFVVSDGWEFDLFDRRPDYIIANSVFTHLRTDSTREGFRKLEAWLDGAPFQFFATFTRSKEARARQPDTDHYYGGTGACAYTQDAFAALGAEQGWEHEYIGPWGHFRNEVQSPQVQFQMMMRFFRT